MKVNQLTHKHIVEQLRHIEYQFELAKQRHFERQSNFKSAIAQSQTATDVVRLCLELQQEQDQYEEFERSFQEQRARVTEWV